MVNEDRRKKVGPKAIDPDLKRNHCVSVRLNDAELLRLDNLRTLVNMQRGEYLRCAAIDQLPPTIPSLNVQAWGDLARAAANLNQIAKHLNSGEKLFIDDVIADIQSFRNYLINALFATEKGELE